jgi:hypothetical protein
MLYLLASPTLTLHAPAPNARSNATQIVLQPADPVPTGTCTVQPLDVSGAIPVVEVTINGRGPYRFGIDTGAQGMGRISSELAAQLGLMPVGEVQTPAPGGALDARKIYRAQKLAIGGMTFPYADLVTMAALPNRPTNWSGILGIDLFRKVTLTLDYGRGAMKLSREPLTGGVAAKFDSGVPSIPLKIGDRQLTVDLDTGNGAAPLFVSEAAAKAVPQSGPAVERGKARTSFGEFSIMEATIAVPVTVGGTALPVHAIGWPAARGEGNLGSRGLAGMQLSIDRDHGLVAIEPSGEMPSCK